MIVVNIIYVLMKNSRQIAYSTRVSSSSLTRGVCACVYEALYHYDILPSFRHRIVQNTMDLVIIARNNRVKGSTIVQYI